MRPVRALVGGMAVAVAMIAAAPLAGLAGAAPTSTGRMLVRRVDSTLMPAVKLDVLVDGTAVNPKAFHVTEKGVELGTNAVPVSAVTPTGTVLLADTSAAMNDGRMTQLRAGLLALIAAKATNDTMAVVAYGGTARVVQDFTRDPNLLTNAVNRLAVGGQPVLYAGVQAASALITAEPQALPQVVIAGSGANTGVTPTYADAAAGLISAQALTFAVGLENGPADTSALHAFASLGQGDYFGADNAPSAATAFASVHNALAGQYELTYTSRLGSRAGDIVISNGTLRAPAQVVPGGVAMGAAVNPPTVHRAQAPGFMSGKFGLLVIGVLVLAAGGLLVYGIAVLVTGEEISLARALRPYQERGSDTEEDDGEGSRYAQTAIVQRAVNTTAKFAEERGLLDRIEVKLEQAHLTVRAAEALFFYLAATVIITALALFAKGPVDALFALVLVGLLPPATLSYMAKKRQRKFTSQLPDMLQLLSSSLRAGFSFMQGMEAVSQEVEEPMGAELRRVITEAQLGRPMEDALKECAERMKSDDFDWAVMAVSIQREVGGNLADLLQTVGATMIERERLRRDVKSLTAEGRMSAIVLGILPPGLGLVFYVIQPEYMRPLFTHIGGQIALGVAVVGMVGGFLWMKKIVDIKV